MNEDKTELPEKSTFEADFDANVKITEPKDEHSD